MGLSMGPKRGPFWSQKGPEAKLALGNDLVLLRRYVDDILAVHSCSVEEVLGVVNGFCTAINVSHDEEEDHSND